MFIERVENSRGYFFEPFKRQPHKMVLHTQTIRRLLADKLFACDHFVELALKWLIHFKAIFHL